MFARCGYLALELGYCKRDYEGCCQWCCRALVLHCVGRSLVTLLGLIAYRLHFDSHDPAYTLLSQQEATRAAFSRASGPSLGSICAGSLTIATVQTSLYLMRWARRLTTPPQLQAFAPLHPLAFLSRFITSFDTVSTYALVYIGITGEGFWPSATRARGIVANHGSAGSAARVVGEEDDDEEIITSRRRRGRTHVRRVSDCKFHLAICLCRSRVLINCNSRCRHNGLEPLVTLSAFYSGVLGSRRLRICGTHLGRTYQCSSRSSHMWNRHLPHRQVRAWPWRRCVSIPQRF